MTEIIMTVNLLLVVVQSFYLGMQWEKHRSAAATPNPPPPSIEQGDPK